MLAVASSGSDVAIKNSARRDGFQAAQINPVVYPETDPSHGPRGGQATAAMLCFTLNHPLPWRRDYNWVRSVLRVLQLGC